MSGKFEGGKFESGKLESSIAERFRFALVMTLALAGFSAALAEQTQKPTPRVAPPQAAEPAPPRYEPQLLRLAEISGSLAWLRDLCGATDAGVFHAKIAMLIDSEADTKARKERLAGAYNRGFGGYARFYRTCTPAAQEVVRRYLDEVARISADLAGRYGG